MLAHLSRIIMHSLYCLLWSRIAVVEIINSHNVMWNKFFIVEKSCVNVDCLNVSISFVHQTDVTNNIIALLSASYSFYCRLIDIVFVFVDI